MKNIIDKENLKNIIKLNRPPRGGVVNRGKSNRYCVDISNQIMAAQSLLRKANLTILENHLHSCVKDACMNDNGDEKIEEIISILQKVMSK